MEQTQNTPSTNASDPEPNTPIEDKMVVDTEEKQTSEEKMAIEPNTPQTPSTTAPDPQTPAPVKSDKKPVKISIEAGTDENGKPKSEIFELTFEESMCSGTIKHMIEDFGESDDDIPLPNMTPVTFAIVKKYLEWNCVNPKKHYEKPDYEYNKITPVDDWEKKFVTDNCPDNVILFNVILAANFLDIKDLLDCTTQCVAEQVKGKSPEELRQIFNIKNDFTPEEEEQVRKEHEWCEDK